LVPPPVAVMVAELGLVCTFVVTLNVALVAPAATVTLAGTVATAVLLLLSVTCVPPLGAAAPRLTVPCAVAPPTIDDGATVRPVTPAGPGGAWVMVSAPLTVTPPEVPVILIVVVPLTRPVVTVNVALVPPAGTVTLGGTLAAVLPLPRFTTVAADTGDEKLTVPWLDVVAATLDGFSVRLLNVGPDGGGAPAGCTVSTADFVTPAPDTEMV